MTYGSAIADQINAARTRISALVALLEVHRCNADNRTSVRECVESGQCGCSCSLLIDNGEQLKNSEKG